MVKRYRLSGNEGCNFNKNHELELFTMISRKTMGGENHDAEGPVRDRRR